jgi:hypothetical protein
MTKKLVREDSRAFCYLSNYLYASCLALEKEGVPIKQIEEGYYVILDHLYKENPAAPQIKSTGN